MKKPYLIFCLFLGVVVGVGSIGMVWMRLEISGIAAACRVLEDEREVLLREVQELRGQRSWAMRPSVLASLVEGRLLMPTPERTIHVSKRELYLRCGDSGGIPLNLSGDRRLLGMSDLRGIRK